MEMISLIIPVKEHDTHIAFCVNAIENSSLIPKEIIIVLDGWQSDIAHTFLNELKIISVPKCGPSKCRNIGANMAKYSTLCFVDSDVIVHPDTLKKAGEYLSDNNIDGIIGSYDDKPFEKDIISQFRNLLHHYHHHKNNNHTGVFWGAFSMIKKEAFDSVGGFDESYTTASVEDIDLGYRLLQKGYDVRINAALHVTHRKKWTLKNMIYTDVFLRAKPWTVMLHKYKMWNHNKLNSDATEKLSAALATLFVFSILISPFYPFGKVIPVLSMLTFLWKQKNFYQFITKHFTFLEIPVIVALHIIYFLSAISGYVLGNLSLIFNANQKATK